VGHDPKQHSLERKANLHCENFWKSHLHSVKQRNNGYYQTPPINPQYTYQLHLVVPRESQYKNHYMMDIMLHQPVWEQFGKRKENMTDGGEEENSCSTSSTFFARASTVL
jgi:hypothetical protein